MKIHRDLGGAALSAALAAFIAPTAHAQGAREVPQVTGPIAGDSAANHPFDAASYQAVPIDLAARGYREDEYFVHGTANVYGYASLADPKNTAVKVLRRGPYTNRILVRRPTDPARFSGNVIVEIVNATDAYDLPVLWSYSNQYFTDRGDVWIGITSKPIAIAGLKKFNPTRYAPLSWANPDPNQSATTCPTLNSVAGGASYATEDGLLWDVLSQTAALVRSSGRSNPLHGYKVRAVYGSGWSQSAFDLLSYINAIAPLTAGAPIFDGYLVASSFGTQAPLNQCSPAPAAGDPRNVLRSTNAAIIATQTQTDYHDARQAYRLDSDAPNDRFRYYEAAGPAHVTVEQTTGVADAADTHAAGGITLNESYAACGVSAPLSDFPVRYLVDAALEHLEAWVRHGTVPPHAPLIASTGTPPNNVTTLDRYGNAVGGVRAPELDFPVAAYTEIVNDTSLNCRLSGELLPLPSHTLASLYPTRASYVFPFAADTFRIGSAGFLTPEDEVEAIIGAAERSP